MKLKTQKKKEMNFFFREVVNGPAGTHNRESCFRTLFSQAAAPQALLPNTSIVAPASAADGVMSFSSNQLWTHAKPPHPGGLTAACTHANVCSGAMRVEYP